MIEAGDDHRRTEAASSVLGADGHPPQLNRRFVGTVRERRWRPRRAGDDRRRSRHARRNARSRGERPGRKGRRRWVCRDAAPPCAGRRAPRSSTSSDRFNVHMQWPINSARVRTRSAIACRLVVVVGDEQRGRPLGTQDRRPGRRPAGRAARDRGRSTARRAAARLVPGPASGREQPASPHRR